MMGKTMDVIADILFPELTKEMRMSLLEKCCQEENDYLREHGESFILAWQKRLQS